MNLTEQAEEILEALWTAREESNSNCIHLAKLREFPDVHVLKELVDNGIVEHKDERCIELTERGLIFARDAIRRHRLAERLLVDVLDVKSSVVHETACQFEHHLHKGIDVNVCTLLGHPKFCPHGSPIPPGKCCEEGAKEISRAISRLAELEPGKGGHVAYLHTSEPKRLQMLISMGISPGVPIKLLANFPSILFQLGESQFAVDKSIASEIYVRLGA